MNEDISIKSKQLSLIFEHNKQLTLYKLKQRELKIIEFDIDTLNCAMNLLNHERIKEDDITFIRFTKDIRKIKTTDIHFSFN